MSPCPRLTSTSSQRFAPAPSTCTYSSSTRRAGRITCAFCSRAGKSARNTSTSLAFPRRVVRVSRRSEKSRSMDLALPLFDDTHRALSAKVRRLCDDRLGALTMTELEDHDSAAVEYVALLGQEGLFDPALGKALEGDAPRPELRSLCAVRALLGRTSGLCDGVYGAQVQGMYPIALCGNEDQR